MTLKNKWRPRRSSRPWSKTNKLLLGRSSRCASCRSRCCASAAACRAARLAFRTDDPVLGRDVWALCWLGSRTRTPRTARQRDVHHVAILQRHRAIPQRPLADRSASLRTAPLWLPVLSSCRVCVVSCVLAHRVSGGRPPFGLPTRVAVGRRRSWSRPAVRLTPGPFAVC